MKFLKMENTGLFTDNPIDMAQVLGAVTPYTPMIPVPSPPRVSPPPARPSFAPSPPYTPPVSPPLATPPFVRETIVMPPTPEPTPSRMQLLRSLDPVEGIDYKVSGGGGPTPIYVPVTVPTGPDLVTPPQGTPSLAVPPSGIVSQVNPEEMGLLPGNAGPVIQREQIYPSPANTATFGPGVVEEPPVPLLEKVKRNWILYLAIGVSIYYILLGGKV